MKGMAGVSLAALLAATPLLAASAALGAESGIREITLSSGGLAEVVRKVPVASGGAVAIEVPLDQVNDVLKSLVVLGGAARVKSLSLGGLSPVDEVMRRMPFTAADMTGLPTLLNKLPGTRVAAEGAGRKVEGTVLGTSVQRGADGAETSVLSLMDDEGSAVAVPLTPDISVKILDPAVRGKITEASAALGRSGADGSRTVALVLDGPAGGSADVAYVVPAPIWKAAYRVVTDAPNNAARLQAWAVLENATGENWDDVRLTLSSGSPVTLKQRLFERYWRERQEVPVDVNGVAAPEPDGGAVPPAPAMADAYQMNQQQYGESFAAMAEPAPARRIRSFEAAPKAVEASATEGDVSASFDVPDAVNLAAGETLSVPILDRSVKAERISLFQPYTNGSHPVAALMLTNDTPTSLPPGILTVYDGVDGYVGDAQLLALPAGDTRMVSFALDRKVRISSDETPERTMVRIKVADGILTADVRTRSKTVYRIEGASDGPRTVVIEHPKRLGWEFSSPAEFATSDTAHRLRASVEEGGRTTITAVDERVEAETTAITDADPDLILSWSSEIDDPATKAALNDLADARRRLMETQTALNDLDESRSRIVSEQERIRANLSAVPQGSKLATDYLADMTQQEGELADIEKRRAELQSQLSELRRAAEEAIRRI